ncbi:MAG: galactokinase [Clostridia bacterium]|nr:galactokinase [Clostridia bacterium]
MILKDIKKEFIKIYGGTEDNLRVFASPGRVNLIGEHTDYSGGYVFPVALTMKTTIVLRPNGENIVRLAVTDLPDRVLVDLSDLDACKGIRWGNYQVGVIKEMINAGYDIVGCDMLFDDTVPHGGGLSSSAAIEVSTALAFATLHNEKNGINKPVNMVEMAKMGQMAENNFVGVNCGIMDQFASAMGKENHAVFLNCSTLEHKLVPINLNGFKIIIANTNKKHSLGDSKYNERRSEAERGFKILSSVMPGKKCLGEISPVEFEKNKHLIKDKTVLKRTMHIIYEDDRVLKSVDALNNGDILKFGSLMNESHDSLRDLYEVTGFELDTMVEEARKVKGVIGSRMTGGGFGGCTVNIVKDAEAEFFIKNVGKNYASKTGIEPDFYIAEIGNGGMEIK